MKGLFHVKQIILTDKLTQYRTKKSVVIEVLRKHGFNIVDVGQMVAGENEYGVIVFVWKDEWGKKHKNVFNDICFIDSKKSRDDIRKFVEQCVANWLWSKR